MVYEKSVMLGDDPCKALDAAADAFAAEKLQIRARSETRFEAEAVLTGLFDSKKHPLRGVSEARVSVTGRTLSIRADLGNVQRLTKLMAWVFVPVNVVLAIVLVFVLVDQPPALIALTVAAVLASAIVLLILIAKVTVRQTTRAIDKVLEDAARGVSGKSADN